MELREGATTPLPIVMENAGAVTAAHAKAVNTLRLDGNGGPISYLGSGSITNGAKRGAALFVDNTSGKVSIVTGAGVISGATGINASTTGTGALTIRTGSGTVGGSANNAIFASTVNGPLSVKVGSGDVTTRADSGAINLTSNNGGIFVTATGTIAGNFPCKVASCISGGTPRDFDRQRRYRYRWIGHIRVIQRSRYISPSERHRARRHSDNRIRTYEWWNSVFRYLFCDTRPDQQPCGFEQYCYQSFGRCQQY